MIDAGAFLISLDRYGEETVREKLAAGHFSAGKVPLVEEWLRRESGRAKAWRPWRGADPLSKYQPSKGDLAYRDACNADSEMDPFEEAHLLQGISDTYLSVLASDNTGAQSAGFKAMLDAEANRRGSAIAKRANRIAWWSIVIAACSLIVSLFQ